MVEVGDDAWVPTECSACHTPIEALNDARNMGGVIVHTQCESGMRYIKHCAKELVGGQEALRQACNETNSLVPCKLMDISRDIKGRRQKHHRGQVHAFVQELITFSKFFKQVKTFFLCEEAYVSWYMREFRMSEKDAKSKWQKECDDSACQSIWDIPPSQQRDPNYLYGPLVVCTKWAIVIFARKGPLLFWHERAPCCVCKKGALVDFARKGPLLFLHEMGPCCFCTKGPLKVEPTKVNKMGIIFGQTKWDLFWSNKMRIICGQRKCGSFCCPSNSLKLRRRPSMGKLT